MVDGSIYLYVIADYLAFTDLAFEGFLALLPAFGTEYEAFKGDVLGDFEIVDLGTAFGALEALCAVYFPLCFGVLPLYRDVAKSALFC